MDEILKTKKRDLSGYAALLVAITGFITIFVHKPTEDAAKTGYLELTTAILDVQAATKQNHEDLIKMRSFLDDYTHGHEAVVTTLPSPPPPPRASHPVAVPPNHHASDSDGHIPPAPVPVPPSMPSTVIVRSESTAAPPPIVAPQAVPRPIKAADSIAW